jgi:protein tyrosine phosphatase (PTP) superfamily phosphohydrolase (DUF442 family)
MTERPEILNWRRWNDQITLSGQPTEAQLAELKEDGVRVVINLGPHTNKGALEDEAGTLADLGVKYVYIPVDFDAPTDADYDTFCDALMREGDARVHVHCIYNARVSAFMYRFANEGRGGPVDAAFALMDGIWRPGGVWAGFIGKAEDADQPNRYLGYEY